MEEQQIIFDFTEPYMKKEQIERIIAIVDKLEDLDNLTSLQLYNYKIG